MKNELKLKYNNYQLKTNYFGQLSYSSEKLPPNFVSDTRIKPDARFAGTHSFSQDAISRNLTSVFYLISILNKL